MCGITGIVNFSSEIDGNLLKGMTEVLKHRGPDDEGYFIAEGVGFGHRRLSIIDLKTGHQPIHNEDESIWIVYNGEIYNFNDLRENLEKNGHKFYTQSDTEVIVHAYEEWGEDCVRRFNGMFAFAIWDRNKKQVFLARDRFGIKPLYYYFNDTKLLFGSEIKAILQDKTVKRIPDDEIIYEYLIYDLNDHREATFLKGIKKLMPAHYMIVDKTGIIIKRYWDLKINEELDATDNKDKTHTKDFYELLEDSIRLRLISEVPVGTCLSGGLDSASIVCLINRLLLSEIEAREVIGERQMTFFY
jgi:asparagine synthase (glutamine-hydrolysing)